MASYNTIILKWILILQAFWLIALACELQNIKLPNNFYSSLPVNTSPNCSSYRKVAQNCPSGQSRKRVLQVQISFFLNGATLSTTNRYFSEMINFILNLFLFLERGSNIPVSLICIVVGIAYRNTHFLLPQSRE